MKKLLSLLLALTLLISIAPLALAANPKAIDAADILYTLGLFKGTGTNADGTPEYALDRALTRNEAVTMLVRLLGKEEEAKAGTWETPFTDLTGWAAPYVGYAYAHGLTSGTGATTYSGDKLITAAQYISFVLRALGYDSSVDFDWRTAWVTSDQIGLTHGEYAAADVFLRGDAVRISADALSCCLKREAYTLAEKLIGEGAFTEEQLLLALEGESEGAETEPGPEPDPETEDPYAPEAVYEKLIALKEELPEGKRWTNENFYAWHGGYYSGGFGCVAFAFRLSDAVFGDLPCSFVSPVCFEDVRPGDILRMNGDTHSVIVLEVRSDSVVIAEGNYNWSVHWGRVLTRAEVERADYLMTRYPE